MSMYLKFTTQITSIYKNAAQVPTQSILLSSHISPLSSFSLFGRRGGNMRIQSNSTKAFFAHSALIFPNLQHWCIQCVQNATYILDGQKEGIS